MNSCPFLVGKKSGFGFNDIFGSIVNVIVIIVVFFTIYSFFEEVYLQYHKPRSSHVMIDKCPLASNRDQKIAILENKIDGLVDRVEDLFETIIDNIETDEKEEDEKECNEKNDEK